MTSKELMEKYRTCGSQELPVLLHFLADHWHQLTLADGQKLNDNSDSSLALRELAEAWRFLQRSRRGYNVDFCPDCGHVHVEEDECRFPTGGGRICRCERTMTA